MEDVKLPVLTDYSVCRKCQRIFKKAIRTNMLFSQAYRI